MAHLLLRGEPLQAHGSTAGGPATVEAVLFDKDGTLSSSEAMLQALAEARVVHGCRLLAKDHPQLGQAAGSELVTLLQRAYGLDAHGVHPAGTTAVASRDHNLISTATALCQVGLGWPEALELAHATFLATDDLHGQGSTHRPMATPGLPSLLHQLQQAGVACAVISNDEVAGIEAFLESQQLQAHFQAIWSAEHVPRKPDPAAVHGLCALLGVAPERCALVGDANSDLVMAERAGVAVVLGYSAGWRRRPPLASRFAQVGNWQELSIASGDS